MFFSVVILTRKCRGDSWTLILLIYLLGVLVIWELTATSLSGTINHNVSLNDIRSRGVVKDELFNEVISLFNVRLNIHILWNEVE